MKSETYIRLTGFWNVLVLLVFVHPRGPGISTHPGMSTVIDNHALLLKDADISKIPKANLNRDELPKNYSYTSDYLLYQMPAPIHGVAEIWPT